MKRMRTFLMYGLWIVAFFIFSTIGSDIMIRNSYKDVGNENVHIEKSDDGFELIIDRADSNRQQAYFTGKGVNKSSTNIIEKKYVKVESIHNGKVMQTKYLAFENMQPGEQRPFKLLFTVGEIDAFNVTYVDEIPVNRTIIDDAIDKVQEIISKIKKGTLFNDLGIGKGFNIFGSGDNNDNKQIEEGDYGIPGFKAVSVEGDDISLFIAVLIVLYYAPIPFL